MCWRPGTDGPTGHKNMEGWQTGHGDLIVWTGNWLHQLTSDPRFNTHFSKHTLILSWTEGWPLPPQLGNIVLVVFKPFHWIPWFFFLVEHPSSPLLEVSCRLNQTVLQDFIWPLNFPGLPGPGAEKHPHSWVPPLLFKMELEASFRWKSYRNGTGTTWGHVESSLQWTGCVSIQGSS